jgi:hypothetical protein
MFSILLASLAAVSLPTQSTLLELADKGHTAYVIIVHRSATLPERRAAEELARFLQDISGAVFAVKEMEQAAALPATTIRVGAGAAAGIISPEEIAHLGPEGYILRTRGATLAIAGGRPRGTWDYVISFRHSLVPFPNLYTLRPNIAFMADHGVKGIYEEGNYFSAGGEFAELRTWILAKTLWDPGYDTDRAIDEFLDGYYEAAAGPLRRYIDLLHGKARIDGIHLPMGAGPSLHCSPKTCSPGQALSWTRPSVGLQPGRRCSSAWKPPVCQSCTCRFRGSRTGSGVSRPRHSKTPSNSRLSSHASTGAPAGQGSPTSAKAAPTSRGRRRSKTCCPPRNLSRGRHRTHERGATTGRSGDRSTNGGPDLP